VIIKFQISSDSLLQRWIDLYTKDKLFNPSRGKNAMKQGRKTSQTERLEIVEYTLEHQLNYQEASTKYHVSYDQIYSWVHKYKTQGAAGLEDRRGKKPADKPNKTKAEKAKAESAAKDARIKYLEAEVGLLKKFNEIQRRRT
ncbi:helix-turn-helix domain-containing protein, partial [Ligilactobacillus salitolerans]|uniref:helix-turn-helix domain-containing protein n=1 Tax=Ligilactobacillus salitolerans TaxID=1808352 RepID=UPI001E6301BF